MNGVTEASPIIIDLDAAITGPITGADWYLPAGRTSASDAAYDSLVAKGMRFYNQ